MMKGSPLSSRPVLVIPPTDITVAIIAQLKDSCGNLVQLTQLAR